MPYSVDNATDLVLFIQKAYSLQLTDSDDSEFVEFRNALQSILNEGLSGITGSADTPAQIVAKLESLAGTNRLNASAIRNIVDQLTGAQIKALLEALTGTDRLDSSAIQNLPQPFNFSSLTANSLPVVNAAGNDFEDSDISVDTQGNINVAVSLQTPPSEIRIGTLSIRNGADSIFTRTVQTAIMRLFGTVTFDDSGTGNPIFPVLGARQTVPNGSQLLDNETLSISEGNSMSFTLTGVGIQDSGGVQIGDGRHINRSFTVRIVTGGTARLRVYRGTDASTTPIVDQTRVLIAGDNEIDLESFPLVVPGQSYLIQYTSVVGTIFYRGSTVMGVFQPYFSVEGHPYSEREVLIEGIAIEDEGTELSTLANRLNFTGSGVTVTGTGSEKTVTIPGGGSGITIQDEGSNLSTEATTLNFVGVGVQASGTTGTKQVSIPGLNVQDEGVSLTNNASGLNFTGDGVVVSGTGATKTVSIPGATGQVSVQDEGLTLTNAAQILNFTGGGVSASGTGSTKTINIPGSVASLFTGVATFETQTGDFSIANLGSTYYQTGTQITSLNISDSSIADDLTFAVENELTGDLNLTLSGAGVSFAGAGSGTSFTIPSGEVVLFYVFVAGATSIYPVCNYNVTPTSTSGTSGANPVLTRDTPPLADLAAIADDSLNDNSGLWVVANDQISGTESSVDSSIQIRALKSGLLDANNTSIPTEPTAKNTIVLQAGTIVRVFSSTDLRVVSTPTVREVAARYPDLATSLIAGQVLNLVGQQVLYGIYRNRTAVIDINTSGFVEVRLPSLQNTFDLGYVNRSDVFCFRHAGTNGEVRVRTFQVGTFFSDGTETITLTPGQILCVSPAPSGAVWTIIELGQFTDITLDPLAMSDWYRDETDATAADNFVRLHHRRDFVDGDIRNHIVSVSSANNPITVRFQSRNVQDDIAWISFWSTFVSGVPPISNQTIDLAVIEIGQALTYIESNITSGQDFQFSDPVLGFVPIEAITFLTGTTLRVEFTTALPSHIVVNDDINIQNSSVAANNGTWAITAIAADRLDVQITIPGSSVANNTSNVGFFDRTIYADVTLVSNVLRQTNFNIYRDSARTALITNYPQEWFATGLGDSQTIFAIGYNNDIQTRGSQIAIQDDTEDFFLVKGGPRRTIFSVDNLTSYSNTVTLPKNFEDIEIRTLGTANFLLREFPSELDEGESRRYHIHSHPDNDDDDVQIFIGESATAPVVSDEGLNSIDVKNDTFTTIELYRTAFRSGWRIISPINRTITSGLIFSTAVSPTTLTNSLLPVTLANVLVSQSEDPNRRFFNPGTPANSVTLNANADYDFRLSVEIIYTGPAQSGLLFVPVSITTRIGPGGGAISDNTRLSSNNQSLVLTRYTAGNGSLVQSALTLEVDIVDYQGTSGDIFQWRLDFGNLPPGISLSDFGVKDFLYTFTAKLRLD